MLEVYREKLTKTISSLVCFASFWINQIQNLLSRSKSGKCYWSNALALIFCWPIPQLVRIDATTIKVNMTKHSQDIMIKEFQQQLIVPPHKQNFIVQYIYRSKIFYILFRRNKIDMKLIILSLHKMKFYFTNL